MGDLLAFTGTEWDYATIARVYEAIDGVARGELGLDPYPSQIEIITTEQMLDGYASLGLPLMYRHWSFGKRVARDEALYRKGMRGLAYEIVINSDPCIAYILEENSMAMQALVIAHAAFGHSHFFRHNGLFRQWTDAAGILDYMEFAKSYIARCEERHGVRAVERVLDAAHALMDQGVHRYPRKRALDLREEERREREREEHRARTYNELWRNLPGGEAAATVAPDDAAQRKQRLRLPEENLLFFLEKTAPRLEPWQREILRIVRHVAQYFYPQKQTKVMNEGCATFVHYHVMNRLSAAGRISDSAMMEILHSHTNVVYQAEFDDPHYGGINPYALGFAMMGDILRITTEPTGEDREWFPAIAGNRDPWTTLRAIWADYRDESFIRQFLSPHLIRKLRLFAIKNEATAPHVSVTAIQDERGYREVRRTLANLYDIGAIEPDIQIVDVDLAGDRRLMVQHRARDGILLEQADAQRVLRHIANLWGYSVKLVEVDAASEAVLNEYAEIGPDDPVA
jgi:spore cortex formation protein SpoVR/YcgB (stage V sporulation)